MTMINDATDFDVDALLNGSFHDADEVAEQEEKAATITVDTIAAAIRSVAAVVSHLDREQMLTMISPLAKLAVHVSADERPALEKAVAGVLSSNDDAQWFMDMCPEPDEGGPSFEPFSMADLLSMPPKEWLIKDVIGKGDLVMLYGASGIGKTHVVIDLTFAAMQGSQFARRFSVMRPLKVAYACGEGLSGIKQRFAAVRQFYGANDPLFNSDKNFTFFKIVPQLYLDQHTEFRESMYKFIAEWKENQAAGRVDALDILVIDTLHAASVGSDENSAKDTGVILQVVKQAVKELGCAVVLVHHTGKNGNAERGSSALRGAMDSMVLIEKSSDSKTKAKMTCAKLKDGEQWASQTFDLVAYEDSVRIWWDDVSDDDGGKGKEASYKGTMIDFLASQPGTKIAAKVLAEKAGISQAQAIRILADAVEKGDCQSELMDTSKGSSNRNPLGYFIASS